MKFPHQIERFKERYNLDITDEDVLKLNELVMNSPQLPYTSIHFFTFKEIEVFCYVKNNKIATFLTRQQAYNSHFLRKKEKFVYTPKVEGVFSLGSAFDNIKI